MISYFDTGILVKSYVLESDSHAAIALLEKAGDPILISHVHSVEIPNAIRLKRFRKEITPAQEKAALQAYHADLASGRLDRPAYDLPSVFVKAQELSSKYSASIGCRSLDILHVAAAFEMKCAVFVSQDIRQHELAKKAGFKVLSP